MTSLGVYVYMNRPDKDSHDSYLVVRAYHTSDAGDTIFKPARHVHSIDTDSGHAKATPSRAAAKEADYNLKKGGSMRIEATLQMPAQMKFAEEGPVYVGVNAVPVKEDSFELSLPDRHALTFADYSGDGKQDAQMVTGGLGGGITESRFAGKVFDPTYIYKNGSYM